jgi:hypothetical protein
LKPPSATSTEIQRASGSWSHFYRLLFTTPVPTGCRCLTMPALKSTLRRSSPLPGQGRRAVRIGMWMLCSTESQNTNGASHQDLTLSAAKAWLTVRADRRCKRKRKFSDGLRR